MQPQGLQDLISLSRRYGSDPAWVLAGGGNTSFKNATTMWVKASGASLGSIEASGFCAMDRDGLAAIWTKAYPDEAKAREAAALADLMAARLEGQTRRPSVETLLHGFFPQAYVVHTHPSLINGMTCGRRGESVFRELFADRAVWVPFVDPGYVLARTTKAAVDEFKARMGRVPSLLFLQNHGLLVAADSPAEILALSEDIVTTLSAKIARRPERSPRAVQSSRFAEAAAALVAILPSGASILHCADVDILGFAASKGAFDPLARPFSPDHIVYAGHEFLQVDAPRDLAAAWKGYSDRNGQSPRVVLIAGIGAFVVAENPTVAETALALFRDAVSVAVYAESFGGALHMEPERVQFIRNWEVESYRAKAHAGEGG